jgi:hypothetical protein
MAFEHFKDASSEVLAVFSISGKLQFAAYATVIFPAMILIAGSVMMDSAIADPHQIVASAKAALARIMPWIALASFVKLLIGTAGVYRKERHRLLRL